jgi:hypothetical protein
MLLNSEKAGHLGPARRANTSDLQNFRNALKRSDAAALYVAMTARCRG